MREYKYILEPYKSSKNRFRCPECGKAHQFTKYVNRATGGYLSDNVGKCNRINKCGYHRTPRQHFDDVIGSNRSKNHRFKTRKPSAIKKPSKRVDFLSDKILAESIERRDDKNRFLIFLRSLFGDEIATALKAEYNIGTHDRDNTRTDFFQIDINGKLRQAKNMGYNPETGKKRDVFFSFPKSKYPALNLVQCFFGEHLLTKYPDKKVAIVESEKTAIIASQYLPDFVWLAAGNANGINCQKSEILSGREVFLYPDMGQYDYWKKKIEDLNPRATFYISKLLEDRASEQERNDGLDLADYLINQEPPKPVSVEEKKSAKDRADLDNVLLSGLENAIHSDLSRTQPFSELFSEEVCELIKYFKNYTPNPVQIDQCTRIVDPELFVETNIDIIKNSRGDRMTRPYYDRLLKYKDTLEMVN